MEALGTSKEHEKLRFTEKAAASAESFVVLMLWLEEGQWRGASPITVGLELVYQQLKRAPSCNSGAKSYTLGRFSACLHSPWHFPPSCLAGSRVFSLAADLSSATHPFITSFFTTFKVLLYLHYILTCESISHPLFHISNMQSRFFTLSASPHVI